MIDVYFPMVSFSLFFYLSSIFFIPENVFASSDRFPALDVTTEQDLFSSNSNLFLTALDDPIEEEEDVFFPDSELSSTLDDDDSTAPLFPVSGSQESIFGEVSPTLDLSQDASIGEISSSCSDDDENKPLSKLRTRNPSSCSSTSDTPLNIPDLSNLLNQIGEPNGLLDAWSEGRMTADKAKLKEQMDAYCAETPLFPVPICGPPTPYRAPELPSDPGTIWEPYNNYPLYRIDNARLRKLIYQIWVFSRRLLQRFFITANDFISLVTPFNAWKCDLSGFFCCHWFDPYPVSRSFFLSRFESYYNY